MSMLGRYIDKTNNLIDHLKPLKDNGLLSVYLFGSLARGSLNIGSDIDILIERSNDADPAQFKKTLYSALPDLFFEPPECNFIIVQEGWIKLEPLAVNDATSLFRNEIRKEGIRLL